ncbi:MAG: electron transfer flavoprotein subunit alpha/FixB family protein [Candidatus Bathyarchaeia archaeon]
MAQQTAIIVAENDEQYRNLLGIVIAIHASLNACLWLGRKEDYPRLGAKETFILDPQTRIPETIASTIAGITKDQGVALVVLPSTRLGREVGPRVAASLRAGYAEGVIGIETDGAGTIFRRLSFGGTVVERIRIRAPVAVITAVSTDSKGDLSAMTPTNMKVIPTSIFDSKKVTQIQELPERDDMRSAERIVAAGRGVRKQQDLSLINDLANVLNAKFACSRPLVEDLKWCAKDNQVGLSGQIVKPKLYFAIGISGQIQHTVGMRDSKTIVAINSDKSAPIFQVTDYGIVGDLYQLVPELAKQLRAG